MSASHYTHHAHDTHSRSNRLGGFVVGVCATALLYAPALANVAHAECTATGVCVEGAKWLPGESLSGKQRAREARKHRKRSEVPVSVSVDGDARASVFVDGVWVDEAPIGDLGLKPGRHDVQLRDGRRVLAIGVLEIPNKATSVELKIPPA